VYPHCIQTPSDGYFDDVMRETGDHIQGCMLKGSHKYMRIELWNNQHGGVEQELKIELKLRELLDLTEKEMVS
jgi:hypothetical protein